MMSEKMVNLEINGRFLQAQEGATVLDVARREGIPITTLCHHDAIEPSGACRLCVVEITHPGWGGWKGLVTACLYPVEEGLQITTDNEEIRKVKRTILDLLLARCPESALIRKLAAQHGVTATSFKRNEVDTTCILCGQCVRICEVKGCRAISTAGRGIEKRIAIPFKQPPPDCIGCASCAHICPTDTIKFRDEGYVRKIWGHSFEMVKCEGCGRPVMPVKQVEFEAARAGLDPEYLTTCPACSQKKTLETIRGSFTVRTVEGNDVVSAAQ